MNPRTHLLVHGPEPGSRIHGEIPDQFKHGKRHERNFRGKFFRQGLAGKPGSSVYDHGAGTADAGPAAEIELEGRILLFPDPGKNNEKGHAVCLLQIKDIRMGNRLAVFRVVSKYIEFQSSSHLILLSPLHRIR